MLATIKELEQFAVDFPGMSRDLPKNHILSAFYELSGESVRNIARLARSGFLFPSDRIRQKLSDAHATFEYAYELSCHNPWWGHENSMSFEDFQRGVLNLQWILRGNTR